MCCHWTRRVQEIGAHRNAPDFRYVLRSDQEDEGSWSTVMEHTGCTKQNKCAAVGPENAGGQRGGEHRGEQHRGCNKLQRYVAVKPEECVGVMWRSTQKCIDRNDVLQLYCEEVVRAQLRCIQTWTRYQWCATVRPGGCRCLEHSGGAHRSTLD